MRGAVQDWAVAYGKVLIVSGSSARRRELCLLLSNQEYELIESGTTLEAEAAVAVHRVDLVLIDVAAPGGGAERFCRTIHRAAATRLIPIFVLADSENLSAEVRAIEAGADQFLVAPWRADALRARIHAGLRRKALVDSLDDSETVLFSLARSVGARDPDLGEHCQRLALMGATLGAALKLPTRDILSLEGAGYLHDIGKISMPDRLLFKAGPLNAAEWETMKSHTIRGELICRGVKSLAGVLPIIRSHHERWDGSGYPDGLAGRQIPLLARALQLADIYDALTAVRPYKRAFSSTEAMAIIRDETAKGWRDPELVKVFAELRPMFQTPVQPEFAGLSLQSLSAALGSQAVILPRTGTVDIAATAGSKTLDFLQHLSLAR